MCEALERCICSRLKLRCLSDTLLEIPSNMLLQRFGGPAWLSRIMITWGSASISPPFLLCSVETCRSDGLNVVAPRAETRHNKRVIRLFPLFSRRLPLARSGCVVRRRAAQRGGLPRPPPRFGHRRSWILSGTLSRFLSTFSPQTQSIPSRGARITCQPGSGTPSLATRTRLSRSARAPRASSAAF